MSDSGASSTGFVSKSVKSDVGLCRLLLLGCDGCECNALSEANPVLCARQSGYMRFSLPCETLRWNMAVGRQVSLITLVYCTLLVH